MNGGQVTARGGSQDRPWERPIEREVRQSLSLLGLTAVAMGLYLGLGLLAVRVLG